MQINTNSMVRNFLLSLLLGLFTLSAFAQEWGVVEKSTVIEQFEGKSFYVHTIVKGNTFYSISKVYGVSSEEIKAANPQLGGELKLGAQLLIPIGEKQAVKVRDIPQETPKAATVSYDNFFFHVVKQGETLSSISRIFGVGVQDLVAINKLSSTAISPGFHLKIPELQLIQMPKIASEIKKQDPEKQSKYTEYTVQPKETLFSIAKRYGIGLETLKYINNLSTNDIQLGQILLIPNAIINKEKLASKDFILHRVQAKEGLYGIARKYGVSIDDIRAINSGLSDNLALGQELKIPRKPNTQGYIQHQVSDRKEKLSDIAREYEISMNNLKALNPSAPSKLRRGETVNIPLDFVDKTKEEKLAEFDAEEFKPEEEEVVNPVIITKNTDRIFNIAIMLPLYLNDMDSLINEDKYELSIKRNEIRPLHFIEFYEGAQLAIDSMRKLGMKVDYTVYDVSGTEAETLLLLENPMLRNVDLIISLLHRNNFKLVSEFSKKNRIPLVNSLSKRQQIVYENSYVFKLSPKPDALYTRIGDFVGANFADYNTILVRNNPYQMTREYNQLLGHLNGNVNPKAPLAHSATLKKIDSFMKGKTELFLDTLQRELRKGDYSIDLGEIIDKPFDTTFVNNPIKTVIYSIDSLDGIMDKASLFRDNLIVTLGSDEVFAIELFTKLNFVRDSISIKVIGLPDWHNYMNLDVDYSQPFSLRVASENFVDYNKPQVNTFVEQFQAIYHKVPEIDTYSFLGYDATFYFLQALYRFGDNMMDEIPDFQIPLLQNQLRFERQGRGGYENVYWNLYRQQNYQLIPEK